MVTGKVIFLDRDGVINRDSPDYVKSPEDFEFLPGSLDALGLLCQEGFTLIIITNQSIINRGMVHPQVLEDIHQYLHNAVQRHGGRITDIFYCPHRPEENCLCRKPRAGLIQRACTQYTIDPATSIMIGDSAKDIACGRNAGCGANILVQTGNGPVAAQDLAAQGIQPEAIAADLLEAARMIIENKISMRRQE